MSVSLTDEDLTNNPALKGTLRSWRMRSLSTRFLRMTGVWRTYRLSGTEDPVSYQLYWMKDEEDTEEWGPYRLTCTKGWWPYQLPLTEVWGSCQLYWLKDEDVNDEWRPYILPGTDMTIAVDLGRKATTPTTRYWGMRTFQLSSTEGRRPYRLPGSERWGMSLKSELTLHWWILSGTEGWGPYRLPGTERWGMSLKSELTLQTNRHWWILSGTKGWGPYRLPGTVRWGMSLKSELTLQTNRHWWILSGTEGWGPYRLPVTE